MNKKLNLSPVLLSILGVAFMYMNTLAGVVFFTALLVFEVKDEVKVNVSQYVILQVVISLLSTVLAKLSGIFMNIVKLFTDEYDTINTASKFDIFKHANNILGYVSLAIIIIFLIVIAKKRVVKVPTLYQAVTKAMASEE